MVKRFSWLAAAVLAAAFVTVPTVSHAATRPPPCTQKMRAEGGDMIKSHTYCNGPVLPSGMNGNGPIQVRHDWHCCCPWCLVGHK